MQYISSFYNYLEFEKRCSPHTLTTYETDLRQFTSFLKSGNIDRWEDVDSRTVRNWMVKLMNDGISTVTIHRKISAIKTFFRFLMREQVIDNNPVSRVAVPKKPKRLPVFVKEKEMDLLLDTVSFGSGFNGVRDRFIISLLYATGMRLSELVNLRISGIDRKQRVIKVLGKRNKERIIPYYKELDKDLSEYLSLRDSTFPDSGTDILILTSKGKPVYPKLIYRVVKKYLALVSTVSKKSPHVLRHSFATALLNRGADLNAIKELLGHANLSATEIYTHVSFEKLNTIYKQAHPRA
ncbi:MAG: tyrosine-type recombinase/integrase [Chlorobi bacterium]|nr:tyrosine-type recombinase/integrase [Chlorobiota bacterium]